MAFSEHHADRIRRVFSEKGIPVREISMMGGLCIMVDDKMCCGLIRKKDSAQDYLMARVGPEAYEQCLSEPGALPMDFTGRPMIGFIFVGPEGFDMDGDLEAWVDRCLAYNPEAKSSKKS